MFERFTDEAREAVKVAQERSRTHGEGDVALDDLLYGILVADGPGVKLLDRALDGYRAADVLASYDDVPRAESPRPGHIPFAPPTKVAFDQALRDALRRGENFIDTAHLLVGVAYAAERTEGLAGLLSCADFGASPQDLTAARRQSEIEYTDTVTGTLEFSDRTRLSDIRAQAVHVAGQSLNAVSSIDIWVEAEDSPVIVTYQATGLRAEVVPAEADAVEAHDPEPDHEHATDAHLEQLTAIRQRLEEIDPVALAANIDALAEVVSALRQRLEDTHGALIGHLQQHDPIGEEMGG